MSNITEKTKTVDATGTGITDAHESNNKSNWPRFLISFRSQVFFGMASLILSFVSGLGIFPSLYYIFYLDKKNKKYGLPKALNIAAIFIPVLGFLLSFILLHTLRGLGLFV